jgi:hypothetical protein
MPYKKSKKGSKKTSKKGSQKLKLLKITKSPKKDKKLRATFERNGRIKNIDFGYSPMSDFTKHKDPARKERYIARHKSRENFNKPDTAGALSRWVLWNKPSLQASITDYKRRFNL